MTTKDFVEIGINFALPITLLILGYLLGRKQKVDEVRIKRGYELAEQIIKLFQETVEKQEQVKESFQINFEDYDSIEAAVDRFESLGSVLHREHEKIKKLAEIKSELIDTLRVSDIYFGRPFARKLLLKMREYLDLGNFLYEYDGIGITNTYYVEFFRNLADPTIDAQRAKLSRSILGQLGSLRP